MSDDKQLKQNILAELAWEPSINAAHIGVTTHNGVATIGGHVEHYFEKRAAEAAAGRVKGVKAVVEDIEVRVPAYGKQTDEELATAALNRLASDISVPRDAIKLTVEKGWVTLNGAVDWHYQLDAAAQDVRGLMGVIGVSNNITIKPRVNVSNLSDDIMHALNRSWFFDPTTINVSASDGRVKLTGTVDSWNEREIAAATAWAAPGATSVENNIVVS